MPSRTPKQTTPTARTPRARPVLPAPRRPKKAVLSVAAVALGALLGSYAASCSRAAPPTSPPATAAASDRAAGPAVTPSASVASSPGPAASSASVASSPPPATSAKAAASGSASATDQFDYKDTFAEGGETKLRRYLEARVANGQATTSEKKMLLAICRHLGDVDCTKRAQGAQR
jgi:hypothetical protein